MQRARGVSAGQEHPKTRVARGWGAEGARGGLKGAPGSQRARPIRKAGEITGPGISGFVARALKEEGDPDSVGPCCR